MAASLLFVKGGGLRDWPWYEASLDRMKAEIGVDVMMHEATQELLRLLLGGADGHTAMRETEAYLRGLWRARYEQGRRWEPSVVPLEDERAASATYTMDDDDGQRLEAVVVVAHIRQQLTPREWELVVTAANCGSQVEAARLCGTKKQAVNRAMRKAREVLVDRCVYKGAAL